MVNHCIIVSYIYVGEELFIALYANVLLHYRNDLKCIVEFWKLIVYRKTDMTLLLDHENDKDRNVIESSCKIHIGEE